MTLEINRNSVYTYRISPLDPCLIERRQNKHGARWHWYMHRDSKTETKIALLKLGKGAGDEGQVQL